MNFLLKKKLYFVFSDKMLYLRVLKSIFILSKN